MPYRRKHHATTVLCLVALTIGCGDDEVTNPPPAPTGALAVTTTSIGSAIDADGYTVLLNAANTSVIGANDSVAVEIAVGRYDAELAGLADNCAVMGENPVEVTVVEEETTGIAFGVSCPPYNDYIAFASLRDGGYNIFVMETDGSNPTNLLPDTTWLDSNPAWSPDARRIAFKRQPRSNGGPRDLYILDTATMDLSQVTSDRRVTSCSWSPDGTRLVYDDLTDCTPDACANIYVINSDGSDPVNLTPGTASGYEPDWSPDGTRIAFSRSEEGGVEGHVHNIWVMRADGLDPVMLTDSPPYRPTAEPAWSPDGTHIAYVRHGELADSNIWVMDSDGSNQVMLTEDEPGYQAWNPSWSPDGSRITYWAYRPFDGRSYQIYIMEADGSNPTNITDDPGVNTDPDWSPGQ